MGQKVSRARNRQEFARGGRQTAHKGNCSTVFVSSHLPDLFDVRYMPNMRHFTRLLSKRGKDIYSICAFVANQEVLI